MSLRAALGTVILLASTFPGTAAAATRPVKLQFAWPATLHCHLLIVSTLHRGEEVTADRSLLSISATPVADGMRIAEHVEQFEFTAGSEESKDIFDVFNEVFQDVHYSVTTRGDFIRIDNLRQIVERMAEVKKSRPESTTAKFLHYIVPVALLQRIVHDVWRDRIEPWRGLAMTPGQPVKLEYERGLGGLEIMLKLPAEAVLKNVAPCPRKPSARCHTILVTQKPDDDVVRRSIEARRAEAPAEIDEQLEVRELERSVTLLTEAGTLVPHELTETVRARVKSRSSGDDEVLMSYELTETADCKP